MYLTGYLYVELHVWVNDRVTFLGEGWDNFMKFGWDLDWLVLPRGTLAGFYRHKVMMRNTWAGGMTSINVAQQRLSRYGINSGHRPAGFIDNAADRNS